MSRKGKKDESKGYTQEKNSNSNTANAAGKGSSKGKKKAGKVDVQNPKIKESAAAYTPEVLPFKGLNKYGVGMQFTDDSYFDIMQFRCKDLTSSSDDDIARDMFALQKFFKMYSDEIKIIAMNFPCNTKTQQKFFKEKIKNETNQERKEILEEKLEQCITLEREVTDREYYLFYYAKDVEGLEERRSNILSILGNSAMMVDEISQSKKILLLQKLMNMNTLLINDNNLARYIIHEDTEEQIEKLGYDPYLIEAIQPAGGISFKDEKYISTGDGYTAILYIYKYPETGVDRHWLTYITNIQGAVCTVDVTTENPSTVRDNIRRSMSEYGSRVSSAKTAADATDAAIKRNELNDLYVEVTSLGEVIKCINCHVFLSAKTKAELNEMIDKIQKYLNNNDYKCSIQISETYHEWSSLFLSKSQQDRSQFKQKGQPFTATTLAGGYPFHFTSLNDPYGSPFGMTTTNGASGSVRFDSSSITSKRTHYNISIVGNMGMGKSTAVKKLLRDRFGRGDYLRVVDKTGEYAELATKLGGYVISLDGSGGIINPFQINLAGDNDQISYAMHITKLSNMYKFLAPESSHEERLLFEELVGDLYVDFKIIPDRDNLTADLKITDLPVEAYPIASDFLKKVRQRKEVETYSENTRYIYNIERVWSNLIASYGNIFNGHSSVRDLINAQFIVYDVKGLVNLKDEIFDVQLFQALSLSWANAVKVGTKSKQDFENGLVEIQNIPRFYLVIDEAAYSINANKPYAVEALNVYAREGRKFFAGIVTATQSIRDYIPEASSNENVEKIKVLFDLAQYKFIFKQDSNTLDLINNVFGASLTDSELQAIPFLEKGQCLLCINGEKNVNFHIECTDEELRIFKGGL